MNTFQIKINDYFDEIEDLNIGNSYFLQFDKETEVNAFIMNYKFR